jgi:hypothetical protein
MQEIQAEGNGPAFPEALAHGDKFDLELSDDQDTRLKVVPGSEASIPCWDRNQSDKLEYTDTHI